MDQDIIRADREYRKKFIRKSIIIYPLCLLIGAMIILWGFPLAQQYVEKLDCKTAYHFIKVAIIIIFLSILPLGIYMLRFGQRITESEQIPPPGVKVIRDTRVIRGDKAIARGRIVIFLSLLILCLALIGAFYIPFKMDRIIQNKEIISTPSYSKELTGQLQPKLSCENPSKDVKES